MEFDFFLLLESVAVIAGFTCVYWQTRENIWAWPAGLLSVILYTYIFWDINLYSDMILNGTYIVLNLYGWWAWRNRKAAIDNLKVSTLKRWEQLVVALLMLFGTYAWGSLMQQQTDAAFPFGDAFTTVTSLIAQYLLTRKVIDNWLLWIIADVVAIYIYVVKGLYLTAILFVGYLLLCVLGYLAWRKTMVRAA
ncbi:MAG: nicotinamide riboside transporter PnuC [Bacteroidota bacterium]